MVRVFPVTRPRRYRPPASWTSWAAGAAVAVLALAGCSAPGTGTPPAGAGPAGAPSTSSPEATRPDVRVAGDAEAVSYLEPVRLEASGGVLASVQVSRADGGEVLDGDVSADRSAWVSQGPPRPGTTYRVEASVGAAGEQAESRQLTFSVAAVPDDRRVAFNVVPDDGATVGIGQPIVVRFLTPVTERAAMEKVMRVDARTPAGAAVTGGWHWLNGSEVHWRPKEFWTPGTTVDLDMRIAGVKASQNRTGRRDYRQTFRIGPSHITRVDGTAHRTTVYRDGKLVGTWRSGGGKKGLETYSGTYIVLGKDKEVQMDSCSARITCDKKNPEYYDLKVAWATRVTRSGTFLHAASWDRQLGRANVSHGCIHLADGDAKAFYEQSVIGDVVIVSRTGRGPAERIATQDPGLYDWNLTWAQWQAGSALT